MNMNIKSNQNTELLLTLAEEYYIKNLSIADIAKKHQLSRYKISKYLEEAKEKNIVTIKLNSPFLRNEELENHFQKLFSTNIFILKETEESFSRKYNFWQFAAYYIQDFITSSKIIALSWGDSVYNLLDEFKPTIREDLTFTQFIGESGKYSTAAGSMRLIQKAAMKYEATYTPLSAPLYVFNDAARELLLVEPFLINSLENARRSDILISSVATSAAIDSVPIWKRHKNVLFGNTDDICGLVYGRAFDKNGSFLNTKQDKTFGLQLEEILAIPHRVGVCNNKFKSESVIGALKGNIFTHLFLDEKSAIKILSLLKD